MKSRTRNNEEGSIQVLLAGYVLVLLVVVITVSAATSLYIERKRLFALADAASLAAAESFDLNSVTVHDGDVVVHLTDDNVHSASAQFLDGSSSTLRFDSLRLTQATSPDGRSARVTLSAVWHPPILSSVVPWSLPLQVTSQSRVVFE